MASIDQKIKTLIFDTTKKGDKMATTKKAEDKKVLPTSTEKSEKVYWLRFINGDTGRCVCGRKEVSNKRQR